VAQSLIKAPGALVGNGRELRIDGFDPALLGEGPSGQAFRAFLVLSQQAHQFTVAGWSPEAVFWSRYFWFRRFLRLRSRECGFDAGLEQQEFNILEHPFPDCSPDWAKLQEVQGEADAI
jgi:hypothetical protein